MVGTVVLLFVGVLVASLQASVAKSLHWGSGFERNQSFVVPASFL